MNLCIDRGNSSTKIAVFDNDIIINTQVYSEFGINQLADIFTKFNIKNSILSEVVNSDASVFEYLKKNSDFFLELNKDTEIPFINKYTTPNTLGKDRIAAVAGAWALMPDKNLLVIDAGTAITFDFIDAGGIYHGGNISPGVNLRIKALNQFTAKLPLIEASENTELLGNNTESAINSGVINGIVFEIDGYIDALKGKYQQLSTFLTGGSIFYFDKKLKNSIFAEKFLVLFGLNRILQYNVKV